jgi:hypothetical protein
MNLAGKKVFILVETIYNDLEFWYPYYRLKEAGAKVIVVGPMGGMAYNGKAGLPVKADAGMANGATGQRLRGVGQDRSCHLPRRLDAGLGRCPARPHRHKFFRHQG